MFDRHLVEATDNDPDAIIAASKRRASAMCRREPSPRRATVHPLPSAAARWVTRPIPTQGLATSWAALAVFAIDRACAELAARQQRLARMSAGHVREITLVIRDTENLQVRSTSRLQRARKTGGSRPAAGAGIARPMPRRWHSGTG
ncbi:hypothetical protein SBBP2_1500002 [Burkholderiales bacterium]|nr:hypothetical protein SBBP2_1500002 [Burkholderiales bacterium]